MKKEKKTYADLNGDATRACIDPVLMTRPQPFSIMRGSAALVACKVEERQTAMMASHLRKKRKKGFGF